MFLNPGDGVVAIIRGKTRSGRAFFVFSRPSLVSSEKKKPMAYIRKTEANSRIEGFSFTLLILNLKLPSAIQFKARRNCDMLSRYLDKGRQQINKASAKRYTF
jgi:hypothetical protein